MTVPGGTVAMATSLAGLCVLDASLAGYRSVCGRSAFVRRQALDRRAAMVGAAAGAGVVAALGAWFSAVLAAVDDSTEAFAALSSAGLRMLVVYGAFTLVTAGALAVFWVAPPRWGSLAMVTILGPLTLLRPVVLSIGSVAAVAGAGAWWPLTLISVAAVLVAVGVETVLLAGWGDRAARAYRPSSAG